MSFILSFSCDFLNLFVLSFCFPLKIFSFATVFSHNFWFSIFASVAEGREFLRQCGNFQVCEFLQTYEISQVAKFSHVTKFRNLRIFTRLRNFSCATLFTSPCPFTYLQPSVFCAPLIFPYFFEPQPLTTYIYDIN